MITAKDLVCRFCVFSSAPIEDDNTDHFILCRLGPYAQRIDPLYWCAQGRWIMKPLYKTDEESNAPRDMLKMEWVVGRRWDRLLIDPWEE